MTEFSKNDLLQSFKEIDDILTLSLASITYFHRDKDSKMLSETWMMHYGRVWNLKHLADSFQDEQTKIKTLDDFKWTITKFLIREPYVILEEYCRINSLSEQFESQEWYQISRILRNFCTHNILDPTRYRNIQFPVRWENYEITSQEVDSGKVDFTKFDIHLPQKIFEQMQIFAESLPEN